LSVGRTRGLKAVGAAAVAALLLPASALATGLNSGVTAGEITSHSAIVWGRAADQGSVKAQVATDAAFNYVVRQRILQADDSHDFTVQTKFDQLNPATTYHYRFCLQGDGCSAPGKFETAPGPSAVTPIRFAFSGDETAVSEPGETAPFWGNFKAFGTMALQNNDFNIDFGDTIYSDPEVPNFGQPALTVQQKWAMYRKKLRIGNMKRIRAATGLYNHWDDHEFINDFSIPENGQGLYDRGVRAFRDYMPVTYTDQSGIYRSFRWGKNLEIFFLDERSFRSAKASANHKCDNPETGQPDLAPTAPQSTRNFFAALVPSLSEPVSQTCKDAINSRNHPFLGGAQLTRFLDAVKSSTANWKVVMNETPIQQFYALPYDRWEGYAVERVRLLHQLQNANVKNLVFMTTDTHAALANVVRYRTLQGDVAPSNAPNAAPSNSPYRDFVIGPVATTPFWQEIDEVSGATGSGKAISNAFFKPAATGSSPPGGMGMACAQGGENSYAQVTVTATALRIAYKDEDGNTLLDSDGATPCGPYVLNG
jgi:alkaline phosphatase D